MMHSNAMLLIEPSGPTSHAPESFGFIRSMSARGNCYDNATMESFFGVIKREELNRFEMPDLAAVRYRVFDYIETYYNRRRIHTALEMSPAALER